MAATVAIPDLEVRALAKRFATHLAVDDLSFSVARGSFFSILGPSGCGKTTLLRMIAGFERPDAGRIELAGRDVTSMPPHLRDTNTVFQDYALFPHMSVAQNIGYGLSIKGVPKAERTRRVDRALDMVRLTRLGGRRPNQLSGGQRQRVALARAVINEPEVLLLDEPLGALDLKLRQEMQLELKEIQARTRTTFVYVTHDQEEAMSMATRIAVMNEGRVEQIGVPSEIYHRPTSRFVADFIGESNFLDGIAVSAEGGGRWRCRAAGGLEFLGVAAGPLQAGQSITAAVRPEKVVPAEEAGEVAPGKSVNACKGVVEEAIYVGDATRYRVGLGPDGALTIKVTNRLATRPLSAGAMVALAWSPDETRLFPRAAP